jgi:small subunit ribosomal protein S8e
MGLWQGKDNKKPSGGIRRPAFKIKKKAKLGSEPTMTRLGTKDKVILDRVRGGNVKRRAKIISYAVVIDKKTGKARKEKIINILETPANREYARRNIITKGALILVESGKAIVTSRPGQDGIVNAVLLQE